MKILCFAGWKQSGKDSSADYLVENLAFIKCSFAKPLKDMVAEQYNIPRGWCDNPVFKEKALLQLPIDPVDPFSNMICTTMNSEFKNKNSAIIKFPGEQLYWTPRALCILEGSVKRSVNNQYWVQKVIEQIENNESQTNFVISDLRFASEVQQLKDAFGDAVTFIRINRWDKAPSNDPSEIDLDKYSFDYYIKNDKDLAQLYKQVSAINKAIK